MLETIILYLTIVEKVVIISATGFASWWTYKTFALKERKTEIKDLKSELIDCHAKTYNYYYENEYTKLQETQDSVGIHIRSITKIIRPFYIKVEVASYLSENIIDDMKKRIQKWNNYEYISKYLVIPENGKREYVEDQHSELNKDLYEMLSMLRKANK